MKVEDIVKVINLCEKIDKIQINHNENQGLIKIVILQRGWVVIGNFYQEGSHCWIENGFVIRRWGTDKGLGQLAIEGKQPDTILDPIPKTEFHELTIVAAILCDQKKWK